MLPTIQMAPRYKDTSIYAPIYIKGQLYIFQKSQKTLVELSHTSTHISDLFMKRVHQ